MKKGLSFRTNVFLLSVVYSLFIQALLTSCTTEVEETEISETFSIVDNSLEVDTTTLIEKPINLENEEYSFQTIHDEQIGWGYQILKGTKVYINQPHIPAVSGNNGFSSEKDAVKTAEFALYKIENGIVPPTLSKTELDSLGVLNLKE